MQIWVDADACPKVIKEVLFRAAERAQMMVTLVANQGLKVPPSRYIRSLQVASGKWQAGLMLLITKLCAAAKRAT